MSINMFQLFALYGQGKQVFDELEHDGILTQTLNSVAVLEQALKDPAFSSAIAAVKNAAKDPKALIAAGEGAITALGTHADVIAAVTSEIALLESELAKPDVQAFIAKAESLIAPKK